VAEYDTKGTRLTCLTLADGAVDVTLAETAKEGESGDEEEESIPEQQDDEEDEEAEEEAEEDESD
jgi:protein MAK11